MNADAIDLCGSDTEEDEPVEEQVLSRYFGTDNHGGDDEDTEPDDDDDEDLYHAQVPSPPPRTASASGPSSGVDQSFFSSLLAANGGLVRDDRPFDPMAHQLDAATFCSSRPSIYALVHEPGLGKTCTTMLIYAALERLARQQNRPVGRLLISSPAAVCMHWRKTVLDYLTIKPCEVLLTSKADEVTAAALRAARVLILTRDCLTNIFRKCHVWVEQHHQIPMPNGMGQRWVGGWTARGEAPLFSFLAAEGLELMTIDEAHSADCEATPRSDGAWAAFPAPAPCHALPPCLSLTQ